LLTTKLNKVIIRDHFCTDKPFFKVIMDSCCSFGGFYRRDDVS